MSTTRGRVTKVGGMAVDTGGASGRTDPSGTVGDPIVRPAFRVSAQVMKPTTPATLTGFFDPSSIVFWRLVIAAAAVGYILNWHLKVGRVRIPV